MSVGEETFQADDEQLADFYAVLGVGGETKCRDLCKLALKVATQGKLIIPPTHDVGCFNRTLQGSVVLCIILAVAGQKLLTVFLTIALSSTVHDFSFFIVRIVL